MEQWNGAIGIVEYWNTGLLQRLRFIFPSFQCPLIPLFHHYSTIPVFHYSSLKSFRQGDIKGAALIHGARYGNVPAMSPGYGPCQAEAQPCSRLGSALVAAVESFENTGQIGLGDAGARVFNREDDIVTLALRERNINVSSGLRVFDGVIDNIGKHPLEHSGIADK